MAEVVGQQVEIPVSQEDAVVSAEGLFASGLHVPFMEMDEDGGHAEEVEHHADVAPEAAEGDVLAFDGAVGEIGVVEGLEGVEAFLQGADGGLSELFEIQSAPLGRAAFGGIGQELGVLGVVEEAGGQVDDQVLGVLPEAFHPVLGEHPRGEHLAVVVSQQRLGEGPTLGGALLQEEAQGAEEEEGDVGDGVGGVFLHARIASLEIIGVEGVLEVEEVVARRAEVLEHGHVHAELAPPFVALGAVGVQEFLQLARFRQEEVEEGARQGEVVHPLVHKVHAMGKEEGGALSHQVLE